MANLCVLLRSQNCIVEIAVPSLKANEAERPARDDLLLGPPGSAGDGS